MGILFLITPVLASSNITVISNNNKTVQVFDFDNNLDIGTFNQSEAISVPYVNSIIKVTTQNTFTLPTFKAALLSATQKDVIMIIILVMLLVLAYCILWM